MNIRQKFILIIFWKSDKIHYSFSAGICIDIRFRQYEFIKDLKPFQNKIKLQLFSIKLKCYKRLHNTHNPSTLNSNVTSLLSLSVRFERSGVQSTFHACLRSRTTRDQGANGTNHSLACLPSAPHDMGFALGPLGTLLASVFPSPSFNSPVLETYTFLNPFTKRSLDMEDSSLGIMN